MSELEEFFGKPIYTYTRAQALADGVLVDVTATAREAGFKWPVAVTEAVWSMIQPSEEVAAKFGCDPNGRLWDVLWMAFVAVRSSRTGGSELLYRLILPQTPRNGREEVELKLHVGPGDTPEPVITIMLPHED